MICIYLGFSVSIMVDNDPLTSVNLGKGIIVYHGGHLESQIYAYHIETRLISYISPIRVYILYGRLGGTNLYARETGNLMLCGISRLKL